MRIEVRSILIFFNDPTFHAQLEMTDIVIESTSWEWKLVPLNKARYILCFGESVLNFHSSHTCPHTNMHTLL